MANVFSWICRIVRDVVSVPTNVPRMLFQWSGGEEMSRVEVINGNKAAAYGALLSRPEVVAAYPITPQTPVVEYLTQFWRTETFPARCRKLILSIPPCRY